MLAGHSNLSTTQRYIESHAEAQRPVVSDLVLAEITILHRRFSLRARHMWRPPGFFASGDVFGPEITLVGDDIDSFEFEYLPRRLRRAL